VGCHGLLGGLLDHTTRRGGVSIPNPHLLATLDEIASSTLLTASETDAELGTFLTAGSKLSHAESSDPIGAFCTA